MNRLIKAEMYRIRHAGLLKWMVLVCLIMGILPMLVDLQWYEKTGSEFLFRLSETISMGAVFVGIFISVSIGLNYHNKTAYYEIMEGHKISSIIFSRLILYGTLMTAGISLVVGGLLLIVGAGNGMGDATNICLRLVLSAVIIVHVCAVSVLLSVSVRNLLTAVVVVYLRFAVLDTIFGAILSMWAIQISGVNFAERVSDWFVFAQLQRVLSMDLSGHCIAAVFLSLILESTLWFALAYRGMKKKKFR